MDKILIAIWAFIIMSCVITGCARRYEVPINLEGAESCTVTISVTPTVSKSVDTSVNADTELGL